jgi:uncharacterized membrane protein
MFCPKCGAELNDNATFCTQCGAPVGHSNQEANTNYNSQLNANYNQNFNQNMYSNGNTQQGYYGAQNYQVLERPVIERGLTAIIGYISWVGFLIAMVGGDRKDSYAKSHLNQALWINLITTAAFILNMIAASLSDAGLYYYFGGISPATVAGVILALIALAAAIFALVCWILGIISACRGNNKPLPLIGNIKLLK